MCRLHKAADEAAVTEDDINEVKGDISAMKYDIIEVLAKNGMDTSTVAAKDKGNSTQKSNKTASKSFQQFWAKRWKSGNDAWWKISTWHRQEPKKKSTD